VNIDYPFRFDDGGRTAATEDADHIRELIEQVLFTTPGERLNRPTFGSGVLQLVFAPANDALAAAVQLTVQGAIQQTLGDLIQVTNVEATAEDTTLHVTISYLVRSTQQQNQALFTRTTT
jgi:phage baseplate assembly protein W